MGSTFDMDSRFATLTIEPPDHTLDGFGDYVRTLLSDPAEKAKFLQEIQDSMRESESRRAA